MSKKKHPEHVNHERWLVSYADFITLLFAFFVVLFASGQSDKKKQTQMAAAMQMAFTPVSMFEPHSKQPALTEGAAAVATPAAIAPPVPVRTQTDKAIANLRSVVAAQAISKSLPPGSLTMHATTDGFVVSLKEAGFFASGSAEIQEQSRAVLALVAAALPSTPMRVEGHTDTVPIHTAQFATNWELSAARATTIVRYLVDHGSVKPMQLAATGYAEFRPIATNETAEGRAKNRRVDIILLAPQAASQ